ncbi:hypothetical protein [Methylobacterium gnaphalii]|uniref:Uncharacterized protein n=1 Tax=Methylobacterium gnaphalii TaxID=1010610 RepID=A0A512JRV1_9HYPH|nr:hypothetical protein [Methylobacterium gnaphalii]GEP12632.1 hypothetical protein MGN01_44770 [Methylobacterium gnaphalii]GJD71782.1 hypothetical protein MMMDOFMJ_4747 [Methylobacterium gnaphalii]GLS48934.1 hypothetical protein GCM10007885_17810 [Methylobacterium gnaphalii]
MLAIDASILSPEPGKPEYRACRLTASDSIEGVEYINAASDEMAARLAAMIANGHGIDLWDRTRFLGSFPPLHVRAAGAKG